VEIFANWGGGDVAVEIMKYFLIICNFNNCKHEGSLLISVYKFINSSIYQIRISGGRLGTALNSG